MLMYYAYKKYKRNKRRATDYTIFDPPDNVLADILIRDEATQSQPISETFERTFIAGKIGMEAQGIQFNKQQKIAVCSVRFLPLTHGIIGIRNNDLIVAVNGNESFTAQEINRLLDHPSERPLKIKFLRESEKPRSQFLRKIPELEHRIDLLEQDNRALLHKINLLEGKETELNGLATVEECRSLIQILSNTMEKVEKREKLLWKKDIEKDTRDDLLCCVVCRDQPRNVIFNPCNHICVCKECAVCIRDCPVCRVRFSSTSPAYIA